jgi:glycosyltransferase involved in cell wall biosynthesis
MTSPAERHSHPAEQARAGRPRPAPRVAIATRLFSPEVGAAAFRLRVLAEAFAAAGCVVEVVTTKPPAGSAPIADGALSVSRWPAVRDENGIVRGYLQYLSFDVPLVLRLASRRAPDLYVSEPPPTTGFVVRVVAALRRRPYAYYAPDIWSEAAGSAGAPAFLVSGLRAVESWVMRGARTVLAVSDEVAARVEALGVDHDRITVVGNGIDTDVFTPDGPTRERDAPYVVYTGTMSEWQGAGVFLEGLALHRARGHRTTAVFLGQGTDLPHLRAIAEQALPGAVSFLGVQPPALAAEWLRGAAAALVSIKPGLGYDFAKPTKVYAATACGTPVLFAGGGATRDLVRDNALGWAVEYAPHAVADALDQAVTPGQGRGAGRLVSWTRANASLRTAADSAVRAVLGAIGR